MDRTRWIIFIVACVAILGGLVFLNQSESVDVEEVNGAKVILKTETTPADNVFGKADSDIVLVEYGDFQCPGCQSAAAPISELKKDYEDDIAFVFRHFPLTSIHPNAIAAASTAEAAGKQGQFWEMHDIIYQNQEAWAQADAKQRDTIFEQYAKQLGLDIEQFKTDLVSESVSQKINFDRSLGGKMGVTGTPAFFLNGEELPSDVASEITSGKSDKLRELIDERIKQ